LLQISQRVEGTKPGQELKMREKSSLRCRSSCSSMFVCYNSPQNSILASAVRTKLATSLLFRSYPPLQFTLFAISAFKCFQVLSKNVAARPKNPRATQWDTFAFPSVTRKRTHTKTSAFAKHCDETKYKKLQQVGGRVDGWMGGVSGWAWPRLTEWLAACYGALHL